MSEKQEGRPLTERPENFIQQDRGDSITTPHNSSTPGGKVAYLSIPSSWSEEIHAQVLQRVRNDLPTIRIESFMTAFTLSGLPTDPTIWKELIWNFISSATTLIVATDSTRVVGVGIKREIQTALRAKKRIILFDVTEGQRRRYFGFDFSRNGLIKLRRGLRTKAEREELDRRLKKRLRKREKNQRRLARMSAEKGGIHVE